MISCSVTSQIFVRGFFDQHPQINQASNMFKYELNNNNKGENIRLINQKEIIIKVTKQIDAGIYPI